MTFEQLGIYADKESRARTNLIKVMAQYLSTKSTAVAASLEILEEAERAHEQAYEDYKYD